MIKLLLYLFIRMKHCISIYSKIYVFIHSFIHSFFNTPENSMSRPPLFVFFSGIAHWAIPEKSKWVLRTWNFHGYWRKNMWKFRGSVDKEVGVFARGVKKTHVEFPWGLCFWPWNIQGVSHNFAEFLLVKACILQNF